MPERLSAPYEFEEFERRAVRTAADKRSVVWSAAASVAVLGLVASLAVVTQRSGFADSYAISESLPVAEPASLRVETFDAEPALVDLGQLALRDDLEDRIAWFDAQLSAGRVTSAPVDQLQQLESTREQLASSLQHVSYAHSLLNL